jgi:hypothetical protein
MEVLFVYAFVANGALGLVPQIDVTVTLTGVLTRLCLPVALIVLGVLHFAMPGYRAPVPVPARAERAPSTPPGRGAHES